MTMTVQDLTEQHSAKIVRTVQPWLHGSLVAVQHDREAGIATLTLQLGTRLDPIPAVEVTLPADTPVQLEDPPVPGVHYGHAVWDDEEGDTFYLAGHVPARRAIAAANRYCRVEAGMVNLLDDHGAPLTWVKVTHAWWKAVGPDAEFMVPATAGEHGAKPFTEVSV